MSTMSLALRSALLERAGFRHAFFTRTGGVSPEPWKSLNFSTASGDSDQAVRENLLRAGAELGLDPERIFYLSQVHGCGTRILDGSENRREVLFEQGDITLSRQPQVGCGVRMADCPAVLLADRRSGAVAAVHSGWRGTVQGAAVEGMKALSALVGGPTEVLAAIGPHIEQCCFEVGADVAEQIAAASDARGVLDESRTKPHADLRRVIEAQLLAAGAAEVDHVRGCTMCDPERFHSYRRDGRVSGRMLAAIVARADGARAQ